MIFQGFQTKSGSDPSSFEIRIRPSSFDDQDPTPSSFNQDPTSSSFINDNFCENTRLPIMGSLVFSLKLSVPTPSSFSDQNPTPSSFELSDFLFFSHFSSPF